MSAFSPLFMKLIEQPKKETPKAPTGTTFMEIRNGKFTGMKKL